jgi:hypothetical protein
MMSLKQFTNGKGNYFADTVKSKKDHFVKKFYDILENKDNPTLFCISCSISNYSLNEIIDLNKLLLNYSEKNYLAIIVEEDVNIKLDDLELKNTCIVIYPTCEKKK